MSKLLTSFSAQVKKYTHKIKPLLSIFNCRSPNQECKYKSICSAYTADSYTCTREADRLYCGKYRGYM